jgi:hypothetical protein
VIDDFRWRNPSTKRESYNAARRRTCDEIEVISQTQAEITLKASEHVRRVDCLHPPAVQGEDLEGVRHRIAMLHLTQYRSVFQLQPLVAPQPSQT